MVKVVPIGGLVYILLNQEKSKPVYLAIAAVIFSGLGDIALDLDRKKYFIFGLGFFLISHVFYIFTFLSIKKPDLSNRGRLLIIAGLLSIMVYLIHDKLGALTIPVFLYMAVIATMASIASLTSGPGVFWGAVIFMLSDSMIAINKFVHPLGGFSIMIIITYYIAQYVIVTGLFRSE